MSFQQTLPLASPGESIVAHANAALRSIVSRVQARLARARTVRELESLDAHLLRDIGLAYVDVAVIEGDGYAATVTQRRLVSLR